jgi:copper chaperone CopZ
MDPADPHNLHDTANQPILKTIQIATDGNHSDAAVQQLRDPLMQIDGVADVKIDTTAELVTISFDARITDAPAIHEAILQSGYKAAPMAG